MLNKDKFRCVHQSPDNDYGVFELPDLEPPIGAALGNAMRRVLLSDIPGFAAKSIKIDGILHEFSTIPGVREDVTEIVLNIKAICMSSFTEGDKVLHIDAVGPCAVFAGDLQCDIDVSILNPKVRICTRGEGARLSMEIIAGHGKGYVPAELNKEENPRIGVIPVDSLYSPIKKVNFHVRQDEKGANKETLILEVWTNRTIVPRRAVSVAAQKLGQHFHDIQCALSD